MREHDKTSENDTVESNDYNSYHYSDDHVRNAETLVDDVDIDNKCVHFCTR